MEQTVNTFNDGMITDLNPLSTPNNVLTSCLNGTFITYDGNEFVLQNDMGNGRVETAYLPSGYVPVGMKEYGGIIYVASHNPISGKSQIGSFPSPERNLSDTELGAPTKTIQINSSHQYDKLELFESQEQKIRPGDKFAISISGANLENYVTDYNTVGKRYIKLKLAVQDSNNNLKIISDELKPIDPQTGKFLTEEQINKGQIGFWASILSEGDLNAADKHIYNNKLMGRLVIIAEAETLSSFEIDWSSISNPSNESNPYTLQFELSAKDWENIYKGVSISYWLNNGATTSGDMPETTPSGFSISEVPKEGIFNIDITPHTFIGKLENFKRTLNIDLSKVNSGEVSLLSWRYYNDFNESANNITISWGLNNYLDQDKYIEQVEFRFYDLFKNGFGDSEMELNGDSAITYICESRKNYNGYFTENISYGSLPNSRLYLANICIKVRSRNNSNISYRNFYRFLYTTTLFNQEYVDGTYLDFKDCDFTTNLYSVDKGNIKDIPVKNNSGKSNSEQSSAIDFNSPDSSVLYPFYSKNYSDKAKIIETKFVADLDDRNKYPFDLNQEAINYNYEYLDSEDYVISVTDIKNITTKSGIVPSEGFLLGDSVFPVKENILKAQYSIIGDTVTTISDVDDRFKVGLKVQEDSSRLLVVCRIPMQFLSSSSKYTYSGQVKWYREYINADSIKNLCGYDAYKEGEYYYRNHLSIGCHGTGRRDHPQVVMMLAENNGNSNPHTIEPGDATLLYNTGDMARDKNTWFSGPTNMNTTLKTTFYNTYGFYPNIAAIAALGKNWFRINNKSGKTNNYVMPLWKGTDDNYYIINSCSQQRPTGGAFSTVLKAFSQLYTQQEWTLENQTYYSAGDGIYNKSCKANVNIQVKVSMTQKSEVDMYQIETENGNKVPFTLESIRTKLNNVSFSYGEEIIEGNAVLLETLTKNIDTTKQTEPFSSTISYNLDYIISNEENILGIFYDVTDQFQGTKLISNGQIYTDSLQEGKIYVMQSNKPVLLANASGGDIDLIKKHFNNPRYNSKNKVTEVLFNKYSVNSWVDGETYGIGNGERYLGDNYLIGCIAPITFKGTSSDPAKE